MDVAKRGDALGDMRRIQPVMRNRRFGVAMPEKRCMEAWSPSWVVSIAKTLPGYAISRADDNNRIFMELEVFCMGESRAAQDIAEEFMFSSYHGASHPNNRGARLRLPDLILRKSKSITLE
ncbi:MAG TPA: hypothetical protein DEQ40_01940 [Oxalobacteraceae bacterium]|jgi:hypothetical protein|nr:hypothetical protein [Oxalobacteraceae bacterium]